jgi:hypothetical protein
MASGLAYQFIILNAALNLDRRLRPIHHKREINGDQKFSHSLVTFRPKYE